MKRKESVSAAAYTYTVLLQPEPEGGYTVTCPALPGLVTYGETLDEARAMAADAIRGYIECLREDGEPIPESDPAPPPLVDRVSVNSGSRMQGRHWNPRPAAPGAVSGEGPPDHRLAHERRSRVDQSILSGRTASRSRMKARSASSIAGSMGGGS